MIAAPRQSFRAPWQTLASGFSSLCPDPFLAAASLYFKCLSMLSAAETLSPVFSSFVCVHLLLIGFALNAAFTDVGEVLDTFFFRCAPPFSL